jgi:hypothetical protein
MEGAMPDLSNLTNDQLRDHARAVVLEVDKRRPDCRLAKLHHRTARALEESAFEDGDITTLSSGGPKEP